MDELSSKMSANVPLRGQLVPLSRTIGHGQRDLWLQVAEDLDGDVARQPGVAEPLHVNRAEQRTSDYDDDGLVVVV